MRLSVLQTIDGPIILVGHSYGGAVISNAAVGVPNVKALVYIAGFAPDKGESLVQLVTMNPGTDIGRATLMQAAQRPFSNEAFGSLSGDPAWKTIPSWYLVATQDHAIPPVTQRFMASRAPRPSSR